MTIDYRRAHETATDEQRRQEHANVQAAANTRISAAIRDARREARS